MRIVIFCLGAALLACGGTPAPKPTLTPPKNSALAPNVRPAVLPKPRKQYIVLASKSLPEGEALENIFARKSAMAEVGPTPGGVEVSLEGVLCTIRKSEAPKDIPKHILPTETSAHGLTTEEAKKMAAATRFLNVQCIPDRELPLRGLPKFAEKVVEGVAEATEGWIHDVHTGRYWPREGWSASRKASDRYSTDRVIRVLKITEGDGRYMLVTRGMVSFGRPDLIVFPLSVDQVAAFDPQLRAMADLLLDEQKLGPGLRMSLGPVDTLLLSRGAYANALTGGLPPVSTRGTGQTALELAIVDPDGGQGVSSDQALLFRKLLIR